MPNTPILVSAEELAATNKAHYPNESAQYRAARNELLVEEIELRRRLEQVASRRRALPPGGELPQDFELPPKKAGSAFPACSATTHAHGLQHDVRSATRKPLSNVHIVSDKLEWHCQKPA